MKASIPLLALSLAACGTLMNSSTAMVTPPPGATIDGVAGPTPLSKNEPHQIVFADGRSCVLQPKVGAGYVLGDIFLTGLVGVVVDAVTGKWTKLDASACPGVVVM
jgi:hypothetical protein